MRHLLAIAVLVACTDKGGDSIQDIVELREVVAGAYTVRYAPDPDPIPFNELFGIEVEVDGDDDATIAVDATMPDHQHGMNTEPTIDELEDGSFAVEGMMFHMTGYWRLDVEVTGASGTETASFDIDCCQ